MSDPKRLRTILAEERELILSGRLTDLPALVARKEVGLSVYLKDVPPARPELVALRRDLLANQTLLESAAKGIRAALIRIEAIRAVESGLTAYNAQGENVRHGQSAPVMERRA